MDKNVSKQELAFTVFYDGLCPVCRFEMRSLMKRSSAIRFVDIAAPDFDPSNHGMKMEELIASVHGIDREGRVLKGLELFRALYRELGMGWLWAWTGWPFIRPIADFGYAIFARYRPRFSALQHECLDCRR